MSGSRHLFDLKCLNCGQISVCDGGEMGRWLSDHGMLRREKNPDLELLVELFKTSASTFQCRACGETGMVADRSIEADEEIWSAVRKCEACGHVIPVERLEIFPETRHCTVCKDSGERGIVKQDPQYCSNCGGLMALMASRGSGISRYEYRCTECRR